MAEEESVKNKRRPWLRTVLWVLLTPLTLFVLLMVLLYVPPVQDFIRRQAVSIASESTGLKISVDRIGLRFPLDLVVDGVQVLQPVDSLRAAPSHRPDTLLALGSLRVRVQAWPLLRGQVEVDGVTLEDVSVRSADLLEGMRLEGTLGRFFLRSHGVDLNKESIVLNQVELEDTHLRLSLADTTDTADADTASMSLRWKILLHTLQLKNVSVDMQMPLDSLSLFARVGNARIDEAEADLGHQIYGWQTFQLTGTSLAYDTGGLPLNSAATHIEGFDPSHIAVHDLRIGIDSVRYAGREMNAVIREFSLNERSGLSISSLTGRLIADSAQIRIPGLKLLTPHSEMNLTAQTYCELINIPTTGRLSARFDARIGKQDVLLLAGGLPDSFKEAYPFHPLVIRAGTEGNLKQMQISRFSIDLPGAFSLNGGGELWNLTDSLTRSGSMDLEMQTLDLNFLAALGGVTPDGTVVVPDSMRLDARLALDGNDCTASLDLRERKGTLNLMAAYNLGDGRYQADLLIDSLQVNHFLPKDSLYAFSAKLSARGQGFDLASPRTTAHVDLTIDRLQYGHWDVSSVGLLANLRQSVATVQLHSDNDLLQMQLAGDLRLDRKYMDGKLDLNVRDVDLHTLGFVPRPLKHPLAFDLSAEARRDSIKLHLGAGDLDFDFKARSTLKQLLEKSDVFMALLARQVEDRHLDHAALRRVLPSAGMQLTAGHDNPAGYILAAQGMSFDRLRLQFGFTPDWGINGRAAIEGFRTDSLRLDTLFFAVHQDTTRMQLQGGVINGPKNPHFTFRSTVTGEIRNDDAELILNFTDAKGKTGVLLGINARPLTEGNGRGNGLLFRLTPDEPVIAYRKFRFKEGRNSLYLHKNMRVYANIDMDGGDGMGFRMMSDVQDTVSLQNVHVELSRFRLSELSEVLPYLPKLTGLFTVEANYMQTSEALQLAAEADIDSLTYEDRPVGDVGVGLTWLPVSAESHYLNAYLACNDRQVATVDGLLGQDGSTDALSLDASLERFPLEMANAFIPDGMATLKGYLNGNLSVQGTTAKPDLQGSIRLDTASVFVRQLGARYYLDGRPVHIAGNKLTFDKFSLYTTSRNPFVIDGTVDFANTARPSANLTLRAVNYNLLDAPQSRESLVYGKVFVDMDASVRGPLDALTMRGNMNLLGNTNVTYVLTDSPLTVEDRLSGLVTFTSFADSVATDTLQIAAVPLGGMEVYMSVHIDDAVRLRADLTPAGDKYIELEGGGDLNLQYTAQGDMSLTGRYTLSGGVMKYSLPIIPLKEFSFNTGSYVDWRGDVMNPTLDLTATERVRASVSGEDEGSRNVNFDVSIGIKGRLESPDLIFDIAAPEDATVQNELQTMGAEERSKQAIAMLATGIYLNSGAKGGGLSMGTALNSVLQSQINALAGSAVKNASISVGVEDRTSAETGATQTDYSFRYSQRFFNDRFQVVIGGKVSTGANATNTAESFIDNISLEYRLDNSGTRYIRVFHNKNYESVLDGEITETGVGLVLRRKMDRLGELFIFKKKRPMPARGKDEEDPKGNDNQ